VPCCLGVVNDEVVHLAKDRPGDIRSELLRVAKRYENIEYREDIVSLGETDHWSSRRELILNKYGDCEDFAIAKWYELLQNGFPEKDMKFMQGVSATEFHMTLQVFYEGKLYYLDNNTNDITVNHIKPLGSYTINRFGVTYYIEGN